MNHAEFPKWFLKMPTYQRVSQEAAPALPVHEGNFSDYDGMVAHKAAATKRLQRTSAMSTNWRSSGCYERKTP